METRASRRRYRNADIRWKASRKGRSGVFDRGWRGICPTRPVLGLPRAGGRRTGCGPADRCARRRANRHPPPCGTKTDFLRPPGDGDAFGAPPVGHAAAPEERARRTGSASMASLRAAWCRFAQLPALPGKVCTRSGEGFRHAFLIVGDRDGNGRSVRGRIVPNWSRRANRRPDRPRP